MTGARLAAAAALWFAASAAHAQGFEGLWSTPVDGGGLVRLERCPAGVCGYVVDSPRLRAEPDQRDVRNEDPALRRRRLRGLRILEARAVSDARGEGWVYNPEEGKTYRGVIERIGEDRLRLTGCIIWPLCRSQTWRRVGS